MEVLRGDAVLLRDNEPCRLEPNRERGACVLEYRSRCHRNSAPATPAPSPTIGPARAVQSAAPPALEAFRPPQPVEVIKAIDIGWKPRPHLRQAAWVIMPSNWADKVFHDVAPNGEVHTSGYCNLAGAFQPMSLPGASRCARNAVLGQ